MEPVGTVPAAEAEVGRAPLDQRPQRPGDLPVQCAHRRHVRRVQYGDEPQQEPGVPVGHRARRFGAPGQGPAEVRQLHHVHHRRPGPGQFQHPGAPLGVQPPQHQPLPVVRVRERRIVVDGGALGVRHLPQRVLQGRTDGPQRGHQPLALGRVPREGDPHRDDVPSAHLLGHLRQVRVGQRGQRGRQTRGHGPGPLQVAGHHLGGPFPVEGDRTPVQPLHRHQADLHRGHHPQPAPAAAQPPEQLRLALRRDPARHTVGGHHLQRPDVVGRVPELPGQDAQPAAQRVRDRAHRGRRAVERGEPVRGRRRGHRAPRRARADGGGTRDRIDGDGVQGPGDHEDTALDRARKPVPGGVRGHAEPVPGGVRHGLPYVVGGTGLHQPVGADREAGLEARGNGRLGLGPVRGRRHGKALLRSRFCGAKESFPAIPDSVRQVWAAVRGGRPPVTWRRPCGSATPGPARCPPPARRPAATARPARGRRRRSACIPGRRRSSRSSPR